MKIYLVGGAVRDELLGITPKEKDFVVVGSTPDEMLAKGYRQVGKDFPVFLHPKTHEEYALARMERKVNPGYTGFTFDTSSHVTLEQDLARRDITINAMAKCEDGTIIDPFLGQADLKKKVLRHVSPAFVEDPVRILRIARFAARFGFAVAPETNELMKTMVTAGEVDALVAERVWKEWERALEEPTPSAFFHVLAACHAMPVLFPDFAAENIAALDRVALVSPRSEVRFAALVFNLTQPLLQALCQRYRIPSHYRELASLVVQYYSLFVSQAVVSAEAILDLMYAADAFRRAERFELFLETMRCLTGSAVIQRIKESLAIAKQVTINNLSLDDRQGKAIAELIKKERLRQLKAKTGDSY